MSLRVQLLFSMLLASGIFLGATSEPAFIRRIERGKIAPLTGITDPHNVRFTQDTISPDFSDGGSVFGVIKAIRTGKLEPADFPPIRVFIKDGIFYSVDNRRLYVFRQVGVPIKYEIMTDKDAIEHEAFKFTTVNDGREIIVRTPKALPSSPSR